MTVFSFSSQLLTYWYSKPGAVPHAGIAVKWTIDVNMTMTETVFSLLCLLLLVSIRGEGRGRTALFCVIRMGGREHLRFSTA